MLPDSPVHLSGLFSCLDDIVIGPNLRRARFRLPETAYTSQMRDFLTPPVLIDAMMRFASLSSPGENPSAVFVPDRGERIRIRPGVNDVTLSAAQGDIYLVAENPLLDGDALRSRWVQAMDAQGRILVVAENSAGWRMGAVRSES
jgi:hypothetical protein